MNKAPPRAGSLPTQSMAPIRTAWHARRTTAVHDIHLRFDRDHHPARGPRRLRDLHGTFGAGPPRLCGDDNPNSQNAVYDQGPPHVRGGDAPRTCCPSAVGGWLPGHVRNLFRHSTHVPADVALPHPQDRPTGLPCRQG